jgi:hypothetical protein
VTPGQELATIYPAHADDAVQLLDDPQIAKLLLFARETQAIERIGEMKVETDVDAVRATEALARGAVATKELDALRKTIVDPLNAQVKAVNDIFLRGPMGALERVTGKRGVIETKVIAYRQAVRVREEMERQRIERERREAEQREIDARIAMETAQAPEQVAQIQAEVVEAVKAQAVAYVPQPTRGVQADSGSATDKARMVAIGIYDISKVPASIMTSAPVVKAILAGAQKMLDAHVPDVPGVTAEEQMGLNVRSRR